MKTNKKSSFILLLSVGALLASCQVTPTQSPSSPSTSESQSSAAPSSASVAESTSESTLVSDPVDERAPVYQGMTIANVEQAPEELFQGRQRTRTVRNAKDNRDHDDHIEEDIDDITGIEIHESSETEYFVPPKDPFIVEVHLSNPHSFEIQSFTLNGEKYSNYMFEPGSTMELLRLKLIAPNEPGLKEYTIDAIKYIDGTEIKDVRMSGEKTIKAGFTYPDAPKAEVAASVTSTTMNFSIDIEDNWNRITGRTLHFYLTDGRKIIADRQLEVGHTDLYLDSLRMSTAYQYGVIAAYDLLDGKGLHTEWLTKETILTPTAVSLTITGKGKDYIEFESTIDYNTSIQDVTYSLYDEDTGDLVSTLSYAGRFENLLSDHDYTIYADYGYYSGDRVYSDWVVSEVVHTGQKAAPNIFVNGMVMGTSASYFITVIDEDEVAAVDSVSIYRKDGEEAIWTKDDGLTSGVFTSLYTGSEFDLVATLKYDYNDGKGAHTMDAKWSFTTEGRSAPTARLSSVTSDSHSVSYSIATDDGDDAFVAYEVGLYSNGELVATSSNIRDTFHDLSAGTEYEVRANCVYDMCDGEGPKNIELSRSISTWNKQMPWFYFGELYQVESTINYSIFSYDYDNTLVSYTVELLHNGEVVGEPLTELTGVIENLESSGGYSIRATWTYDLGDGNGPQEVSTESQVQYNAELHTENGFTYEVRTEGGNEISVVRGYHGEETPDFRIPDQLGDHPVVGIGYEAFANCLWLKNVIIPETVTFMEEGAFYWCENIESINIPAGIKKINYRTFWAIFNIKNIYYGGTERQWARVDHTEDIGLEFYWGVLHFYSEEEPKKMGDFWHYVEGVPTPWAKYEGESQEGGEGGGEGGEPVENENNNLTLYWDDVVLEGSDSLWDNNGKVKFDATYSFHFAAAKAGKVSMFWTMKGPNGHPESVSGVDSTGFTLTCNDQPGTVMLTGLSYEEYFGADYASYQEVFFASFDVVEGENIVTIKTDNQTQRPSVDASNPIRILYQ